MTLRQDAAQRGEKGHGYVSRATRPPCGDRQEHQGVLLCTTRHFACQAGQALEVRLGGPPPTHTAGPTRTWAIARAPQDDTRLVALRRRETAVTCVGHTLPLGGIVHVVREGFRRRM